MSASIAGRAFRRKVNQCFYAGDDENNEQPYMEKHREGFHYIY